MNKKGKQKIKNSLIPVWIFNTAAKNMWRNKARTLISMSAVFFAVVLAIFASGLKEGIFDNLVKNVVSFYTGHIQIHAKGYWDEQVLENSFETDSFFIKTIYSENQIVGFSPRLESFALASSDSTTKGCLVIGIDPVKEDSITSIKNKLIHGEIISLKDREAMLAEGLAKRLKVNIGDTVVLIGQGYRWATATGKYPVKSILHFGSPELNQQLLYLPLSESQELYAADNKITSGVLSLKNPNTLEETIKSLKLKLGNKYEVMSWGEMMPDIKQHIETDTQNMKYVQSILYVLIGFGIFGTQLMLMIERKHEMGMLVAIGMQKSKLILLIVSETILTILIGCLAGILCSIPIVRYFKIHPLRIGGETGKAYEKFGFEAIFPTSDRAEIFIMQGLTVLIICVLVSLYPIYKIIHLNPVKAMK
jgi:ABC-type lipoprotein release transport system permease subunit